MKRPEVKIRFDSKVQKERIARAAKLRKWSLNQFVIESADAAAAKAMFVASTDALVEAGAAMIQSAKGNSNVSTSK